MKDEMMLQDQRAFRLTALVLQFLTLTVCIAKYTPPAPTIVPLYPKGIRMSIPDEDGISLVAFHAKFNEDFDSLEAGTIARDIIKAKKNRWTYEDHTTRLKIGDVIYLWIHVVYDGLGYNLLDQSHQVTAFYNLDGTPHVPGETPTIEVPPQGDQGNTNTGCQRSQTFFNGQQPCIRELLFEDHFNQLERNRWRVRREFSSTPDFEFVVYQDDDEHVSVKDGELRVKPTLLEKQYDVQFIRRGNLIIEGCTGQVGTEECEKRGQGFHILPPVASGMIDTKQSFNFLFGRVEIRAKLPRGDWIYPVITLKPMDAAYGAGYKSGELRIASSAGNRNLQTITGENFDGHVLRGGAVVSPEGPIRQDTMSKKISNNYWSDDYHIYELEWTPTSISVKVDGEKYGEKENPAIRHKQEIFRDSIDRWAGQNAPFDKSFYLSFGVAVGGHGEFLDCTVSGNYAKPWRNPQSKALLNFFNAKDTWASTWTDEESTLKVDYVKIWAL